jgi:hypothetical protein
MQETFAKQMETLLGVGQAGGQKLSEPVDFKPIVRSKITTEAPETKSVNEAGSQQTDDSIFQRRRDGNYVMALSGVVQPPEDAPTVIERQNPRETNQRWKFIIADISKPAGAERAFYVRDNDGTLRTATRMEREIHLSLYPLTVKEKAEEGHDLPELWQI